MGVHETYQRALRAPIQTAAFRRLWYNLINGVWDFILNAFSVGVCVRGWEKVMKGNRWSCSRTTLYIERKCSYWKSRWPCLEHSMFERLRKFSNWYDNKECSTNSSCVQKLLFQGLSWKESVNDHSKVFTFPSVSYIR